MWGKYELQVSTMAEKLKKIASKTDSAVKTAESWFSFGREAYQMLGATIAFSGVITAGAIKIWRSALSVGWEYYALIGPPVFIITLLIISFVHMKVVLWKRAKTSPEVIKQNSDTSLPPLSISSLEEILGRISALEGVDNATGVASVVAPLMQNIDKTMDARFEEFKTASHRALDTLHQQRKRSDAIKFAALAEILDAKNALERFNDLSEDIEVTAKILDEIPLCDNWNGHFNYFKGRLSEWGKFKDEYVIPTYKPLFNVNPEDLKSTNWSELVNKLPSDDGLEYKHYRLALCAYRDNHSRMKSKISGMAKKSFHGRAASNEYVKRFEN